MNYQGMPWFKGQACKSSPPPKEEATVLEEGEDSVMSDLDESGVTYTKVSSPFEGLSDIRSPRADDHEYLELPWMPEEPYVEATLQAPPSPDYVPSPKEPEQAPPSPDYVPDPEHADDEISDPEADPEEDDDEDPEEDPIDYPADGGDDGDDEDEPLEEDEDDDVDIEADQDEEEEEHPAPADSVVVALPTMDQAPSAKETKPFETDESTATPPQLPVYRVTARISIPAPVPTPVWSDAEVPRLLAISTPPSSPLSPWSSPLPRYHLHHYHYHHPYLSDAPSSGIPPPLPISIPTSSPPLLLPSASCREDKPEVTLPPWKRLGITLGPRYEVGESSSSAARPTGGLRADYGFVATMDREIKHDPEREVGYGITDSQDTDEIYTRLDDEQSQRQLLAGIGDHTTGTGGSTTGTGYRTAGTAGTCWRSCTSRAARRLVLYLLVIEENGTKTNNKAMIDQGVTAALAARDANRNGDDSHTSGTGGRRTERIVRECTY
ncbi:hypothetical protein Tco_1493749 [Tanacetum coccineum]